MPELHASTQGAQQSNDTAERPLSAVELQGGLPGQGEHQYWLGISEEKLIEVSYDMAGDTQTRTLNRRISGIERSEAPRDRVFLVRDTNGSA